MVKKIVCEYPAINTVWKLMEDMYTTSSLTGNPIKMKKGCIVAVTSVSNNLVNFDLISGDTDINFIMGTTFIEPENLDEIWYRNFKLLFDEQKSVVDDSIRPCVGAFYGIKDNTFLSRLCREKYNISSASVFTVVDNKICEVHLKIQNTRRKGKVIKVNYLDFLSGFSLLS